MTRGANPRGANPRGANPRGANPRGANPRGANPDELSVIGIECWGHHGVFEHERRDGQRFVIDLTLGVDTAPAAASDDLRDTIDYGSLVDEVTSAVQGKPVDLIETLATRIAGVCLLDARVEWARVTVHKPDAPIEAKFADVQLTITRHRPPTSPGKGEADDE